MFTNRSSTADRVAPPPDDLSGPDTSTTDVEIPAGTMHMVGTLTIPGVPSGVVIFAHVGGSDRRNPGNIFIASALNRSGFGTLLLDLLTPDEASRRSVVFDIPLLARRVRTATAWVRRQPGLHHVPLGYFGDSTGTAAALAAAAGDYGDISAIVSRGGRPDLAVDQLGSVRPPTLLIVAGGDSGVLGLNERALEYLRCESRLVVVPGATHLFEEPGALDDVAEHTTGWFTTHFATASAASHGPSPWMDTSPR